jgi:nucleoside-diphosphate-sugar epimerase
MKRVLVTGGTGFVGANLVRCLLESGASVRLLVRPGYNPWRIQEIQRDIQVHEVLLNDAKSVLRLVETVRPDWVFHLATHGAYSWQRDWREMVQTNLLGTMTLLEACLKVGFEAFVNTGSSSEYGFQDHAPSETEVLEPNSHYAITKAAATWFCRQAAQNQEVHIPTLRLYSVFGPFEEPGRLLPALITCGLNKQLPPLVAPEVARDFVYAEDVAQAFLLAAQTRTAELGPVFNVGSGVQTTMREAVSIARSVMSIEAEPIWGSRPNRKWDSTVWISDNRKIRSELGWNPSYDFRRGFLAMLDWFVSRPRPEYARPTAI